MELSSIDQSENSNEELLSESFTFWERMRIWYNVIVGLSGIIPMFIYYFKWDESTIILAIIWGIMANALYSNAFTAEAYLIRFKLRNKNLDPLRYSIFVLCTLFSAALTAWTVVAFSQVY